MRNLSKILSELLPMIFSEREFDRDENRARTDYLVGSLTRAAHKIETIKAVPSADPGIQFISEKFVENLDHANSLLHGVNREHARLHLQAVTHYCISCHTMTEDKVIDYGLNLQPDLTQLTFLERAEFYAATRQFNDAIKNFEYALTNGSLSKDNPSAWNEGVQKLLAVVIRVKNDPSLALEMVSRFFDSDTYPKDLAQAARDWRIDIKAWRKESRTKRDEFTITEARDLVHAAQRRTPIDGLVLYMRASAILHTLLAHSRQESESAEVLYLSGVAAENLSLVNYWTLPMDYFEGCVRLAPKGPFADSCINGYELSMRRRYGALDLKQVEDLKTLLK